MNYMSGQTAKLTIILNMPDKPANYVLHRVLSPRKYHKPGGSGHGNGGSRCLPRVLWDKNGGQSVDSPPSVDSNARSLVYRWLATIEITVRSYHVKHKLILTVV